MDFSDNPFFWSGPSIRPTTFRGFSPYSPEPQEHDSKQPVKMSSTAPKVVHIPVHFVGSEPSPSPSPSQFHSQSRSASALKIQKVFRGFLVRRSMKRIIAIRKDVDEIERRISQSEMLEMIRRDKMERLRVNEMLMALLLKLDSVRGVDSGVRDCRRVVAKKAIALQERVDAIVSAVDQSQIQILGESKDDNQQNAEVVAQAQESTVTEAQNSAECNGQFDEAVVNFDHGSQESPERKDDGQVEVLGDVKNSDISVVENFEEENCSPESVDGISEGKECGDRSEMNVEDENCMDNEVDNFVMVDVDCGTRGKEEEHCLENESPSESCHSIPAVEECMEESLETSQMQSLSEGGGVNDVSADPVEETEEEENEKRDDNKRNQELLERMIDDNQKMMNMMSQLSERSEMQMKMLNSLTRRVEQLEKAYICHILKRKKLSRLSD